MNKNNFSKWLLLVGLAMVLLVTACGTSQESPAEEAVEKPKIVLGENSWTTALLNTAVAKIILEEEMGYTVEVVAVTGEEQFPLMESGEVHAVLETWPSSRSVEIQEYTQKGTVEVGGDLGVVGIQGWFIPAYVMDAHPELASWEAFKDPEIAALFSTSETGEQGQFLLVSPDWNTFDADFIETQELPLEVVYAGSEEALEIGRAHV